MMTSLTVTYVPTLTVVSGVRRYLRVCSIFRTHRLLLIIIVLTAHLC